MADQFPNRPGDIHSGSVAVTELFDEGGKHA